MKYLIFGCLLFCASLVQSQSHLLINPMIDGDPLLADTGEAGILRASITNYRISHPGCNTDNILSVFGVANVPVNTFSQGKPGDELVDGWFQPTMGTPDYWNSDQCAPGGELFPGSRKPGGKIGLVLKITPEYIETQLTEPLEPGTNYYLEFYIRAPKASVFQQLTQFGALFTKDKLINSTTGYIKAIPQLIFCDTSHLNNPWQWQKVSGCFTAEGGEEFLTLGCFDFSASNKKMDPFINPQNITPPNGLLSNSGNWWYYLIDEVKLVEDIDCQMYTAPAQNLTLLIDVSASMFRGKFMDAVKEDVSAYLTGAGKNTYTSILSYASQTQLLTRDRKFSSESEINQTLDSLIQGSKTDIRNAIRNAFNIADNVKDTTLENRIILVTDAAFEVDETMILLLQKARDRGIGFIMFHYGEKRNEALEKVLERNGGEYQHSNTGSLQKLLVHKVECNCNIK